MALKGDIVRDFHQEIVVDGKSYTVEAAIYVERVAGDYPKVTPAPFASFTDGQIEHRDEWCEYFLECYGSDGDFVGVWDSIQCDNGIESQRGGRDGAEQCARATMSELEDGTHNLLDFLKP